MALAQLSACCELSQSGMRRPASSSSRGWLGRCVVWTVAIVAVLHVSTLTYRYAAGPPDDPAYPEVPYESVGFRKIVSEHPEQSEVWHNHGVTPFDNTKVPELHRPHLRVAAAPPPQPAPAAQSAPATGRKTWAGLTPDNGWPLEDPNSCNGFFGNGWTEHFDLLDNSAGARFNCSYHPALTTHICEGTNVWVDADKMKMVRGGEPQDQAPHREERDEIPVFSSGAFKIHADNPNVKFLNPYPNQFKRYTVDLNIEMYRSFEVTNDELQCDNVIEGTTVFIVRFEYHNLFHTSTDWYNTYQAARSFAGSDRVNVLFVDAHAKSPMDDVWEAWCDKVWYVKHLPKNTCFRRVLVIPYGWHASLNPVANLPGKQCPGNERVREFSNTILRSFGLEPGPSGKCTPDNTAVMMVRRENYKRRPQHDGSLELRLGNEPEILDRLHQWADSQPNKVKILEGYFHKMTMLEQLKMAQEACVIVGAHGAGMSHILFARPGTKMVEVRTPSYRRPHFDVQSMWAGMPYTVYDTNGLNADAGRVVELVEQAVRRQ